MGSRLELHDMFKVTLGINNVYFQPPPSIKMKYPCIVYERDRINTSFADNKPYQFNKTYRLTYIDSDPDSTMPDRIAELPMCVFERNYVSDNLYHSAFRITY